MLYASGIDLGPIVGEVFHDTIGWRWTSLVLVPFSLAAGVLCVFFIPSQSSNQCLHGRWNRVDRDIFQHNNRKRRSQILNHVDLLKLNILHLIFGYPSGKSESYGAVSLSHIT